MPDPGHLMLFLAAALILALTPGPGIFYVAARILAGGRADGIASTFGICVGGMVHVVAGGLGVSALILASAHLFTALKLTGAIYLIWLGYRTWRSAGADATAGLVDVGPLPAVGPRRAFREGILVETMNPQTAAFFLAFIPQFVDLARGHVAVQFMVLGIVSASLNTLVDAVIRHRHPRAHGVRRRRSRPCDPALDVRRRGRATPRPLALSRGVDACCWRR